MSSHFSCHFPGGNVHNPLIEDPLLEFCPKSTTEDDKDSFEAEYEFGYDPSIVSCLSFHVSVPLINAAAPK